MAVRIVLVCALTLMAMFAGKGFAAASMKRADGVRILMDDLQLMRSLTLERLLPAAAALSEMKSPMLRSAGDRMRKNAAMSLKSAWDEEVQSRIREEGSLSLLSQSDAEEVSALFGALGSIGKRDHENLYANAIARLGKSEEEARRDAREKMKLYASLGALSGLAVGILLI